jgi:hypothetical protein
MVIVTKSTVMDDATLRSLLDALAATPSNAALRIAVIRALHAAGDRRGRRAGPGGCATGRAVIHTGEVKNS